MKQRILAVYGSLRFLLGRALGRSHLQETVLLRRPGPSAGAASSARAAVPTMILKTCIDGQSRMIVLPLRRP